MPLNARKKSRSPNAQVYWRANQFPSARVSGDALKGKPPETDANDQSDELTDTAKQKLDYLRNRFKSSYTSGIDGTEGPCGE